jgi:uncharacterized protein YndB with AHSA1/START domain
MPKKDYQPGAADQAAAHAAGERWTLIMVRELRHPPARVWGALTEPAQLRAWSPFDADRDLGAPGDARLIMAGEADPQPMPSTVRHAERPTLLEYTWGDDVLRWELEATASGTRLTLRHTTNREWLAKVAAGWHICLDVAERALDGAPVGRIVAEEAKQHGWERLEREYAVRLGVPSTGYPA